MQQQVIVGQIGDVADCAGEDGCGASDDVAGDGMGDDVGNRRDAIYLDGFCEAGGIAHLVRHNKVRLVGAVGGKVEGIGYLPGRTFKVDELRRANRLSGVVEDGHLQRCRPAAAVGSCAQQSEQPAIGVLVVGRRLGDVGIGSQRERGRRVVNGHVAGSFGLVAHQVGGANLNGVLSLAQIVIRVKAEDPRIAVLGGGEPAGVVHVVFYRINAGGEVGGFNC